ncbi:TniB family NTP-binding protein [Aliiroseovarius sp. F47248L]|uniref:TniB family NTP-binding protein n=1 Tax=Aliiroseovarius sp. F47248L TaxID=2926420 RepID=UPI001FF35C94|nr:TniB family NTP-binding protein [Aliiroseovarius sp. F47248L]MCK0138112.1 TniB family NTP-binding protein [Aliiroseovarius sp. F47248L]
MKDFVNKEAALDAVRNLHIGLDWDAEAALHVKRLLARDGEGNLLPKARYFTKTGETRGMLLVGDPGSGKSHLMDRTLTKIPELAPADDGVPPIIACPVPSPATFKSMALALLEQSGYPHANTRQEAWSLWQLFRHRLSKLGIAVLWVDEAQDLFCADRKAILRAFKSLMQGEDAVAVILSGTEELAQVIRTDPQVKRRFTAMVLPELTEAAHGAMFRTIMADYCARLDLAPPMEADLVARVFHGARYRFGRAVELLLAAMEFAIAHDAEHLTSDHFASAYAMNEACPASQNVFYADNYVLLKPDADGDMAAFPKRGSGKGRR